jgi:hypothetical protein
MTPACRLLRAFSNQRPDRLPRIAPAHPHHRVGQISQLQMDVVLHQAAPARRLGRLPAMRSVKPASLLFRDMSLFLCVAVLMDGFETLGTGRPTEQPAGSLSKSSLQSGCGIPMG